MKEWETYRETIELEEDKSRNQVEIYANASDKVRNRIKTEAPLYENVVIAYDMRCLADEDYAYIETCREIKREKTKKDIKKKDLPKGKNQSKNTKKTIKRNRK